MIRENSFGASATIRVGESDYRIFRLDSLEKQGIGNVAVGLIGGLPVTSVVARSSVNINAGGKTKLAAIIHGALLLVSVAFLPVWLNLIPLSCLAAILLVTGAKLASPALVKRS